MSKNSPKYLQRYVDMIDAKLDMDFSSEILSELNDKSFQLEKYYNLILMKGVILHYMNRVREASELLKLVLQK